VSEKPLKVAARAEAAKSTTGRTCWSCMLRNIWNIGSLNGRRDVKLGNWDWEDTGDTE
jgi:hypothetical protein